MDLETYRTANGLTWAALADLIGASSPRQARAWALGEERPDEMRIAHIETVTGGVVSVHAQHRKRLEWERQNKRPLVNGKRPRRLRRAA